MGTLLEEVRTVARGWRWTRRPLVPRSAERWTAPPEPEEFPTEWARTPAARAARKVLFDYGLRVVTWSTVAPAVHGLDRLEGLDPPVMFVSNHSSHLDAPLLLGSLPRSWRERTAVAAAADYFFDVKWRAAATALAFNAFPIERAGGRPATGTAQRLIEEGWNLVVFPEGTRSTDGWVGRFRSGAAMLSVAHGVPVVPVAIRGAFAAMPRGRGWPKPGRLPVSVRFGRPLGPAADEDFRSFGRRIRLALAAAWDEDDRTWWEAVRREARGEGPEIGGPPAARWRRVWESSRPLPRPGPPRVWR